MVVEEEICTRIAVESAGAWRYTPKINELMWDCMYCDDCGAWVKWLKKDELHAFEYAQKKREEIDENKIADAIRLLRSNGYFCGEAF